MQGFGKSRAHLVAVWRLIDAFLDERSARCYCSSATGPQMEALRLGLDGAHDPWRTYQAACDRHEYAVLVARWEAFGSGGREGDQLIVEACRTQVRNGEKYDDLPACDLVENDGEIHSDELMRRTGYEIVGAWRSYQGQRLQAREGRIWVVRKVPCRPSQAEVAARLHVSRKRVQTACDRCVQFFKPLLDSREIALPIQEQNR